MSDLTNEQIEELKMSRKSDAHSLKTNTRKGSRLAVNQQAAQISATSASASYGDGEALALQEAEGFVMGYVETSQAVTELVAVQIEAAREGFSAAICSSAPSGRQGEDREAFLQDFGARLRSLTGLTN